VIRAGRTTYRIDASRLTIDAHGHGIAAVAADASTS
jgi:hypothetical protein